MVEKNQAIFSLIKLKHCEHAEKKKFRTNFSKKIFSPKDFLTIINLFHERNKDHCQKKKNFTGKIIKNRKIVHYSDFWQKQ